MDLNEIAVFLKVVETGSFVKAAGQLGMPKSTVSAKVSALEKRLGVTLITRTTRRLHISEAGRAYYKQALAGLTQIQAAEQHLTATQREPQGALKITAPIELGSVVLPAAVAAMRKRYPGVNLELILRDDTVDLVAEGVDLAIRAGELRDSSLIAKKLGAVYFAAVASPKYLKAAGVLRSPKDLENHVCLQFPPLGLDEWQLSSSRGRQVVCLNRQLVVGDLNMIKNLTTAAMGVALLPMFFCAGELKSERLVRVLPEWRTEVRPVHFVYPAQKFVAPKTAAFIEVATDLIRSVL
ncbi:MAG: LysR family transcriptional regulator [Bdellovibrionales bacterium]|nr:LysR family transcriptional regulator [Bdellovibrionales bacterium]